VADDLGRLDHPVRLRPADAPSPGAVLLECRVAVILIQFARLNLQQRVADFDELREAARDRGFQFGQVPIRRRRRAHLVVPFDAGDPPHSGWAAHSGAS